MRCLYFVLTILVVSSAHQDHQDSKDQIGRIKAFDDLLQMYGQELNEASDLEKTLEEMEKLAQNKDLIKDHTAYYLSTLKKVIEKGTSQVLKNEQQRLNTIITSASYQSDGDMEIKYALVRRNIVGAFVDSIANYFFRILDEEPETAFEKIRNSAVKMKKIVKKKPWEGEEEVHTVEL